MSSVQGRADLGVDPPCGCRTRRPMLPLLSRRRGCTVPGGGLSNIQDMSMFLPMVAGYRMPDTVR